MSELKIWNEACQRYDYIPLSCQEVTYDELVTKIGASELVCGQYYTITDFATVHWLVDSDGNYILDGEGEKIIHTGANEPLVVLATSENTLAVDAYSLSYPDDAIKYNWDNTDFVNIKQFEDSEAFPPYPQYVPGFKGVITRREDTLKAIKTNYDFREITYRLWDITQTAWDSGTTYNASEFVQNGTVIYYATNTSTDVEPGVYEDWESYWTLLLDLSSFDNAYLSYSPNGLYSSIIDNVIPIVDTDVFIDRTMFLDDSCNNIVFDECNSIPYVTYGSGCGDMTYGSSCNSMTYGSYCNGMTYGSGCYVMTYGSYCNSMTYGSSCHFMTYGSNCNSMTYGSGCYGLTFPDCCQNNDFKDGVNGVDYTLAIQITDGSNVTHQLSNGTVYQSYIDSSGPPAFIITTNTIGNTGL